MPAIRTSLIMRRVDFRKDEEISENVGFSSFVSQQRLFKKKKKDRLVPPSFIRKNMANQRVR